MKNVVSKIILFSAVISFVGYNLYQNKQTDNDNTSALMLANIDALATNENGDGNFEFPNGAPYETRCNVSLGGWRKCSVRIINCQGGGSGCNRQDCPTHPRFK